MISDFLILFLCLSFMSFETNQMNSSKKEARAMSGIIMQNTYTIEFGGIKLQTDADCGGRIISFRFNGKEILSGKETDSDNYGSTLWPSPQSEWSWPPPAILDSDPYQAEFSNNKIIMISKKDENLGWQFEKEFSFDETDSSVILKYVIINITSKNKKAAPWEITESSKRRIVFLPEGRKRI